MISWNTSASLDTHAGTNSANKTQKQNSIKGSNGKLNEFGSSWQARDTHPKEGYLDVTNELVKYKCEFGHCSVPVRYKSNPQLGRQVQKQNYLMIKLQN